MRHVNWPRFVGLALSWLLLAVPLSGQVGPVSWSNPPTANVMGLIHRTFVSPTLRTAVGYNVLLPPGYDEGSLRYPVIYWLHGSVGDENTYTRDVVPEALQAMESRVLPSFIIVFANGGNRTFWGNSADGTIPTETVLIRELIPHVDATYRTLPDRDHRAIEGMSGGGFGALVLGMKHPDLFGSVVAYAPALYQVQTLPDGSQTLERAGGTREGISPPDAESEANWRITYQKMFASDPNVFAQHSPWSIVPRDAALLRDALPVRIVVGTADGLLNSNELFHDLMTANRYYHEYFVVKDIGHNLGALYEKLGVDGLGFHARAGRWQ